MNFFTTKLNYLFSGTSSTGKTTTLNALEKLGYIITPEPVRAILTDQLSNDGPALPSKDPQLFLDEICKLAATQHQAAQAEPSIVFFDRGLPDLVAYARRFHVEEKAYKTALENCPYQKRVFYFEPWREIFVNDKERMHSFEKYQEFDKVLRCAYQELGFELVFVPFLPIEKRVEFILNQALNPKTT